MSHAMENLAPLLTDAQPPVATLKRFLAHPFAAASRDLLSALAPTVEAQRLAWLQGRLSELSATDFAPAPFLTGQDLISAGLSPGPLFKRILWDIYDAQLEGRIHTPADALALALQMAAK
jgi:poly(A) polymerase